MKIQYKKIYERTREMLVHPAGTWSEVMSERTDMQRLLYEYFLPVASFCAVMVFLCSLIGHGVVQAAGMAVINLASSLLGTWIAYTLIREYLCRKLGGQPSQALSLTAYSAALFVLLHGIGAALGDYFIGQLFILASFIFIRTLYAGVNLLPGMSGSQKTNVLIIASLCIICFPIIITQLLSVIFRISAINV